MRPLFGWTEKRGRGMKNDLEIQNGYKSFGEGKGI